MNGKGSAPRDQTPGPDGKTPRQRYADRWEETFGRRTSPERENVADEKAVPKDPADGVA